MKNKQVVLSRHPWLAMAVVILIYVSLQLFSNWLLYGVLAFKQAVEIDQSRALVAALITCFVVAPYVLHLPSGNRGLVQTIEDIKLFQDRPIWRLLWMAFSSYVILLICQVGGVLALHWYLGGKLNAGFIETAFSPAGYFSVMTLIMAFPPILEEIVFRGIIVTTFLNKYGQARAVIFSALGISFVQLLFLLDGREPVAVALKVAGVFLMGLFYGVLYVRAGSMIPNMIFHYLNSLLGVFLTRYFRASTVPMQTAQVFDFIFVSGLVPVALMVLWVLWVSRQIEEKREKSRPNLLDQMQTLSRGD